MVLKVVSWDFHMMHACDYHSSDQLLPACFEEEATIMPHVMKLEVWNGHFVTLDTNSL